MEDKRCPVFVEGKECGLPLTLLEGEVRKIAIYEVVTYKCSLGHRSYFLHEPRSSRRSTGAKRLGHAVEVRRPAGFANYHPRRYRVGFIESLVRYPTAPCRRHGNQMPTA